MTPKKSSQDQELLSAITDYAKAWVLLTQYDNGQVTEPKKVAKAKYTLSYDDAVHAIATMKAKIAKKLGDSKLYGQERQNGLSAVIGAINQTYGRKLLYPSIEHQAAHLLYFLIKDHPFVDGNKRIGAFLFIYFLAKQNYLFKKDGERKINDSGLVALTVLVASSNPKEKEVMIKLVMNFIAN